MKTFTDDSDSMLGQVFLQVRCYKRVSDSTVEVARDTVEGARDTGILTSLEFLSI